MLTARVIPCLLVKDGALVKGVHFSEHRYIGDPLNAIRIFNQKEVPELLILDISARERGESIRPDFVGRLAKQCYMPIAVGGGIDSLSTAKELISAGAEKVVLCTSALMRPTIVREIAEFSGSQSVVVSIDVRVTSEGYYEPYSHCGTRASGRPLPDIIEEMVQQGAGEILINSIDQDGSMRGFDLALLSQVTRITAIPTIAMGGAGQLSHLRSAIVEGGVSAVAAGSIFVFHGRRRAVLISYPDPSELEEVIGKQ